MATVRERRPGVWEVRVFTGRDPAGKPTQVSKTVRGTRREAQRVAAALEARLPSNAGGRTVADVLAAWREANDPVWAETTRRDYESRIAKVEADPIASINVARLRVADVEHWHARMRAAGVGEAAITGRHAVLRAALAQALRWGWVGTNVASQVRLRQPTRAPREPMTPDEVRSVIDAARSIDPAAGVALRLGAVAGLRRAEIAALQWSDLDGARLRVDSRACVIRRDGDSYVEDVPTRTVNTRTVTLDPQTVEEIVALRAAREQVSPYLFSDTAEPANPDRIGWWWTRARDASGIDPTWRLDDLRRGNATMAITSDHDVRNVASRLGHADPVSAREGGEDPAPNGASVEHSTNVDVLARLGVDSRAVDEFCRRNGVGRLAVFGSALRDDFTPESDVDFLVEFLPGQKVSLFDLARMEMELEQLVRGHRVDLRTVGDLSGRFRDRVVAEAEPVYDVAA